MERAARGERGARVGHEPEQGKEGKGKGMGNGKRSEMGKRGKERRVQADFFSVDFQASKTVTSAHRRLPNWRSKSRDAAAAVRSSDSEATQSGPEVTRGGLTGQPNSIVSIVVYVTRRKTRTPTLSLYLSLPLVAPPIPSTGAVSAVRTRHLMRQIA